MLSEFANDAGLYGVYERPVPSVERASWVKVNLSTDEFVPLDPPP